MNKFHINNKGDVGSCKAVKGNCPFGGEEHHYSSEANARAAFEKSMAGEKFAPLPDVQQRFCVVAENFARDVINANYNVLRRVDEVYFYELDWTVVNTDWSDYKKALKTLDVLENAAHGLASKADYLDLSIRKESKKADKYELAGEIFKKHLKKLHDDPRYIQMQEDLNMQSASKPVTHSRVANIDFAKDLKDSVRDFRHPAATDEERETIKAFWAENNIKNQFQAMLKASELEEQKHGDIR